MTPCRKLKHHTKHPKHPTKHNETQKTTPNTKYIALKHIANQKHQPTHQFIIKNHENTIKNKLRPLYAKKKWFTPYGKARNHEESKIIKKNQKESI